MKDKRCLVTGASGFIGQRLCEHLRILGYDVFQLVRSGGNPSTGEVIRVNLGVEPLPKKLPKFDVLFHLAGKAHDVNGHSDHEEYWRGNVIGTRDLLAGNICRRFVFFSSLSVLPAGKPEMLDESCPPRPLSEYGKSKLEAERMVAEWSAAGGGEAVILRPAMVYGPNCKGNLPRMVRMVAKGLFPPLAETGNKRSMVHIEDVVQAAILAAEMPEAVGKTYIVTDGTPYSTRQIYEWICEALGKPVPGWTIPMPVLQALARVGDGIGRLRGRRFMFDSDALEKLIGSAYYSSHKLEQELGFRPKQHLRESLSEVVRFLAAGQ